MGPASGCSPIRPGSPVHCLRRKATPRLTAYLDLQAEELQYFEALMLQCEQWGQPQAAAQFAQAALHEVEKVYADQNAPLEEDRRALWVVQRHRREDRLCANLFVYALDAGHYAASPSAHML